MIKQPSLQAIFDEMALRPPLSAIETPRISDHEGNNARNNAPKYSFGVISGPPTPISTNPEPDDVPIPKASLSQSGPLKGK